MSPPSLSLLRSAAKTHPNPPPPCSATHSPPPALRTTLYLDLQALLVGISNIHPMAAALSSPTAESLPRWLIRAASRPDNQFGLSASQLGVGFGLYVWISYYMCAFLPYRLLYDEYQSFPRRVAQAREACCLCVSTSFSCSGLCVEPLDYSINI